MTAKKSTTKKATKKQPKTKRPAAKKLSALDAAAQVLTEGGTSMTTGELIEVIAEKKLRESPNGKTPSATLYAAILREITTKGKESRFKKTEPGKFAATGAAGKAGAAEAKAPVAKVTQPKSAKAGKKKPVGKKATAQPAAEAPSADTATEPAPAA